MVLSCLLFVYSFCTSLIFATEQVGQFDSKVFQERVKKSSEELIKINNITVPKNLVSARSAGGIELEKTDPGFFVNNINSKFIPFLKEIFTEGISEDFALPQFNVIQTPENYFENLVIELGYPYNLTIELVENFDTEWDVEEDDIYSPLAFNKYDKDGNKVCKIYEFHQFFKNICTDPDIAYSFVCTSCLLGHNFKFIIPKNANVRSLMYIQRNVDGVKVPLNFDLIKLLFKIGTTLYERHNSSGVLNLQSVLNVFFQHRGYAAKIKYFNVVVTALSQYTSWTCDEERKIIAQYIKQDSDEFYEQIKSNVYNLTQTCCQIS